MLRWIEFNLNHPKIIILVIILITIFAGFGFKNLYFDSSTETLMPKDDIVYKLGQRVKEIFIDSKSFLLVAVEPAQGEDLFSYKTFEHLNNLVTELEEFKDFNFTQENLRLQSLIKSGNISYQEKENENIKQTNQHADIKEDKSNGIESELDREILKGINKTENDFDKKPGNNYDLWDLNKSVNDDFYTKPTRNRRVYNYDKYVPVKYSDIEENLDSSGIEQLKSILRYVCLGSIKKEHELTRDEFTRILEAWEIIYLYKSMEIIKSLINPISGQDIQGTEYELKPVDLIKLDNTGNRILPKTASDFKAYRERLMKNPSFESMYYSIDKNNKIQALALNMVLRPHKDYTEIFNYFYEVIEKYNTGPVVLTQVGNPIIQKFLKEYMGKDLFTFMPLVILLVIITLYLNFRLLRGVLLSVLCIILGTFWTLGLIGLLNIPITLVVNVLPPLLVSVGSSYSIHIFNQYLLDQELIHKQGKKYGLVISMNHISITVMLAGLTTFLGFITLAVNDVVSLRDFGIFASIGILFAMAISIMLIPSALVLMKHLPIKNKNEEARLNFFVDKIIADLSSISLNKAKPVVIIFIIIIIIFSFGIIKIKVETSPVYNFSKNSYINKSDSRISQLFKGSYVISLIVDSGKTDGAENPAFLKTIEDIRNWIVSSENRKKYLFLHTLSFGDIIKRMNMAMNSDNREYYKIPENESVIRDYLEIYSGEDRDSDGRIDSFEQFIDPYYRYVNILVKIGPYDNVNISTSKNKKGEEALKEYIKNHPSASKYRWQLLGETVSLSMLSNLIAEGQLSNVLLSLLIVGIVILFLFKNMSAGIIALIPISTSAIIVYGTMGYLNIPLDIAKTLLTSIAVGIGVDDTIHMLKNIRYNLLKGLSIQESIVAAHMEGGTAIIYNSIAVGLGFSVFMLSGFTPIFYLGWLVVFIMITMTIGSLVLMPAVVIVFNLKLGKELKWRIFRKINLDLLFKTYD